MNLKRYRQFDPVTLLRIFCVALLISLGFAHRPVTAAPDLSFEHYAEDYRLPDGTFADICRELHGDESNGGHPHPNLFSACEACILTSSCLIPSANEFAFGASDLNALAQQWANLHHHAQPSIINRYFARGPPVLI